MWIEQFILKELTFDILEVDVNIGKVFKVIFVVWGNLVLVEPEPAFAIFTATDDRLDGLGRFPKTTLVFCWHQHQFFMVIMLERDVVGYYLKC